MLHINVSSLFGANYYMLFYIAAVSAGIAFAGIAAIKSKFGIREFAVIISAGTLALIIGGKLFAFDGAQWSFLFKEFQLPVENGKATIGAVMGLMVGLWIAGRLLSKNKSVLNLFAVSIPLGLAVQGFGCLSAGCCHGDLTNVPWGIIYGPETTPYIEQHQLGLIPSDAAHSLAVHPSQFYAILACIIIAFVVWKTRSLWKSRSSNLLFSIILCLASRVATATLSSDLLHTEWLGIPTIAWKILLLLLLTSIFIYQEWKYKSPKNAAIVSLPSGNYHDLKLLSIAFICLIGSIQLGDWFTGEENTLVLLIIFPLCGLVILEKISWSMLSLQFTKSSMIIILAFVMMSQKADTPPDTPDSYTSINMQTAFGKYDIEHIFNKAQYNDCNGNPYLTGDHVNYQHTYKTGGIGISRKKYYSKWESTTFSLNVFGGIDEATPIHNPSPDVVPPAFKSTIWNINPVAQYDTRGIGLGLGASFGNVSFDREYNLRNLEDYTPEGDGKNFALQTRLRILSERLLFVEILGGYDAGATGEFNWQGLLGSRFNTDKYMMKAGFAIAEHSDPAFVLKGEILIVPNLFFSPQMILYQKKSYPDYDQSGYRAVIGLEYRFHDKINRRAITKEMLNVNN